MGKKFLRISENTTNSDGNFLWTNFLGKKSLKHILLQKLWIVMKKKLGPFNSHFGKLFFGLDYELHRIFCWAWCLESKYREILGGVGRSVTDQIDGPTR